MDNNFGQPPKQNIPEMMKGMLELWVEAAKVAPDMAHARRTIFNAYVAEGFNEHQALELIKNL